MKRRRFLRTAGAALAAAALPASAQSFLPRRDVAALVAEVAGGATPERGGISMEIPSLAENGNSVPLRIRVDSPMTAADHVRAIHVFSERNPRPRIAVFHLGPGAGRAEIATRVRLAVEQKVVVLASLSGDRYRLAEAAVVVTAAACIDEGVMALGRLQVPPTARRGEAVEVRLLIQHPMETGFRREADGRAVPMNVVNTVWCRYAGREVLRAELGSGVSANPYFAFWIRADMTGEVDVEWVDDAGERGSVKALLSVP